MTTCSGRLSSLRALMAGDQSKSQLLNQRLEGTGRCTRDHWRCQCDQGAMTTGPHLNYNLHNYNFSTRQRLRFEHPAFLPMCHNLWAFLFFFKVVDLLVINLTVVGADSSGEAAATDLRCLPLTGAVPQYALINISWSVINLHLSFISYILTVHW